MIRSTKAATDLLSIDGTSIRGSIIDVSAFVKALAVGLLLRITVGIRHMACIYVSIVKLGVPPNSIYLCNAPSERILLPDRFLLDFHPSGMGVVGLISLW
jgi:hypothetical protein